jgi:hypothetical protein
MNRGTTALSVVHVTLLAGVSAAALFAANSANAGTPVGVTTAPQTFTNSGQYSNYTGSSNPDGSNVAPTIIPGITPVPGTTQVLENTANYNPGTADNVNPDGSPKTRYQWVAATCANDAKINPAIGGT